MDAVLRILTPPTETPDPPNDNPGASKHVILTPHDIPRILRVWVKKPLKSTRQSRQTDGDRQCTGRCSCHVAALIDLCPANQIKLFDLPNINVQGGW